MERTFFTHEPCPDGCVYLGPFGNEGGVTHDLWWCPQGDGPPTVIGRYGDRPEEYLSGTCFADVGVPWAVEAVRRAERRNLHHPAWCAHPGGFTRVPVVA